MAAPEAAAPPAVRLSGIVKRYPRVVANDGVTLTVAPGTVHALLGENGAGKSTLMKILYGMVRPDEGLIEIGGKPAHFSGPPAAIAAGIGMVHQHFMLVPPLTVAENVALGAEPALAGAAGRLGVWDRARARSEVAQLSAEYGLKVDPDAKVSSLSVGEQQRVEIVKVLYRGARILILDEPTAVLTPQEADELFVTLRRLRGSGATIIFISHKLKEVMALCDEATVMRRGKTVGTRRIAETTQQELAQLMVGELDLSERDLSAYAFTGEAKPVLVLTKATVLGARGEAALKEATVTARAGEILGVAGVEGNGQRELAEAACGLRPLASGTLSAPARVGYVPEDRHKHGLLLASPAWENVLLGRQREKKFGTPWALDRGAARGLAAEIIKDYDVRPPEAEQAAGAFSGGNQQKLIVGREISKEPGLLVVAHPTRGVDLGAARLIHEKILKAKAAGAAVLLISADLDEILSLSDRIAVLCAGRVVGQCARAEATVEKLGLWMAGVESRA
jgi:simple sugar transport system ATP-binding protein